MSQIIGTRSNLIATIPIGIDNRDRRGYLPYRLVREITSLTATELDSVPVTYWRMDGRAIRGVAGGTPSTSPDRCDPEVGITK